MRWNNIGLPDSSASIIDAMRTHTATAICKISDRNFSMSDYETSDQLFCISQLCTISVLLRLPSSDLSSPLSAARTFSRYTVVVKPARRRCCAGQHDKAVRAWRHCHRQRRILLVATERGHRPERFYIGCQIHAVQCNRPGGEGFAFVVACPMWRRLARDFTATSSSQVILLAKACRDVQ
jgi:hypothetical protein